MSEQMSPEMLDQIEQASFAADMAEGARLREKASAEFAEAEASFQRSDSDGFLSQWASGLMGQKYQLAADIADNGGKWHFKGLFNASGQRIKARMVQVIDKYHGFGREKKSVWCVLDENERAIQWVAAFKSGPRSKMAQLGLHEADEEAPAEAFIDGVGYGLSGRAWASVKRLDRGYPEGAVVFGKEA